MRPQLTDKNLLCISGGRSVPVVMCPQAFLLLCLGILEHVLSIPQHVPSSCTQKQRCLLILTVCPLHGAYFPRHLLQELAVDTFVPNDTVLREKNGVLS